MSDFKQAVIDILTRYRDSWQGDYYVPFRKAIDEISALSEKMQLSQEDTTKDTTSDLISRLDVLQLIRTLPPEEGMTKGLLETSVKQLPSADASLMQDRCKIDASSDLISRQNALRFTNPEDWGTPDERWRPESEYGRYIQSLPSAEPDRKKGKWELKDHLWECDQCGCRINRANPLKGNIWNYNCCPNCGARMVRGEENEKQ